MANGDPVPIPPPEEPPVEDQELGGDAAPAETTAGGETSQRSSTARRLSIRALDVSAGGPFAMPRREDLGSDDDVDMADVDEDKAQLSKRVQTMPTLPTPPTFRGSTAQEKQVFMKEYEAYCRQLSALETAFFQPFRMPVGACVEDERRRLIAMFDICKPLDEITEADWIDYFWDGRIVGELDFDKVKSIMSSKLRMDTRLTDSNSRVSKLAHEMYQILEKENMEWMIKDEPKKIVNYLMDALAPEQFHNTIKNEMKRESNKPLFKDVVAFITWLRTSCREYLRWELANPKKTTSAGQLRGGSKRPDGKPEAAKLPATSASKTGSGKRKCLKCGSEAHRVKDCPDVQPGDAEKLLREWRDKKMASRAAKPPTASPTYHVRALSLVEKSSESGSVCVALVENTLELSDVLLDSGADVNVASQHLVTELQQRGVQLRIKSYPPRKLSTFDGGLVEVSRKLWLDTIQLQSSAGPLILRHTPAWIFEEEAGKSTLVLSRPVMEHLGYSVDAILVNAYEHQAEYDLRDLPIVDGVGPDNINLLHDRHLEEIDDREWRAATPDIGPGAADDEVTEILEQRVQEAVAAGLPDEQVTRLRDILEAYKDVFRVTFGRDPPVKVEPLLVRVREGATPVRIAARRYPPTHMQYLDEHVDELLANNLAYINPSSRWASPPRIVAKKEPGTYRMTVDTRAVNARTEPIQWPMPILESALGLLEKSTCYFTLDWFRGYWQLPLHPESQELFSIMTHRGILTPTRVLMGGTDSVAYCQHVVEEIFQPLLYHGVLAWLDDILGYALEPVNLLEVLERVLAACKSFGLKLHPGKCHFFLQEARWCGKVVSRNGISHCPTRVQGLVSMPDPVNAGQLQQFTCAVNWMRQNIPQFTQMMAPLLSLLEVAAKKAGGRKTRQLARIPLTDIGWNDEHVKALQSIREALRAMVPLAHPDPEAAVCLFTDASQDFWGAICTQVGMEDLSKPLEQQNHRPLAFLSGKFTASQLRWPTIEKEAFAIVESAKRLEYLLQRPGGFHLFTDHRNLVYMFNPLATDSEMQRYRADKLQRWAMVMTTYQYLIEHVKGQDNIWADILSRWGSADANPKESSLHMKRLAVVHPISPLEDASFEWPDLDEIRQVQRANIASKPDTVTWSDERAIFKTDAGAVWIPDSAEDIIQRLCVVAHAGSSGHRGKQITTASLRSWCWWSTLAGDVEKFISNCIHCVATQGEREPRPFGAALHATCPNEVIHFDYLSLPADEDTECQYVLVIKDDFSGFVELVPSTTADSVTCVKALLSWFQRFGVVQQWVSDRGSHFLNDVMTKLAEALGSQHHFTTAYCPWANGSVEVVNRLLLKCLRAVLSERRLPPSKWTSVLGLVQAALNQQPSDRLGGRRPLTAFTGLPSKTPLSLIFSSEKLLEIGSEALKVLQDKHLKATVDALDSMHRDVATASDKRRRQARARRATRAKQPNFSVGDFVLAASIITYPNKLAIKWQGPKRIIKAMTDWIYEVQDLNPPHATSVHHVSRLRFYAESGREVTEDLLQYALHSQGGHCVERFCDVRHNDTANCWEVEVKWLGLDVLENTWEPYTALRADVPSLLERYCLDHAADPNVVAMLAAHTKTGRRRRRRD